VNALVLRVVNGSAIAVPPSVRYLTTYVLLEQEDWFEKEIAFVRQVLTPGMRALDIGANMGLYSVAIAGSIGPSGRVWAFEPASATIAFLRYTLRANSLLQVEAHRLALSDHAGTGRLTTGPNSELNSLQPQEGAPYEEVPLATLDEQAHGLRMSGVDFVKLDAEGEEVRILAGGRKFFTSEDPLVMFEVKHGTSVNLELPSAFRELGYELYRLVGPSRYLVPVQLHDPFDAYELNLFACKATRAQELERRGFLLRGPAAAVRAAAGSGLAYWRRQPFARSWDAHACDPNSYMAPALDAFAVWQADSEPAVQRYAGLLAAVAALEPQAGAAPTITALSMLARAAIDAGRRELAVATLSSIISMAQTGKTPVSEPCWPAAEQFDAVPIAGDVATWLIAAAADAYVRLAAFSGYFSGPATLPLLDWLQGTPYASAAMERRRQLQGLQSGRATGIAPCALLATASPQHLNVEFWTQAPAAGAAVVAPGLISSID
jgi:FkbM family methyltransferase